MNEHTSDSNAEYLKRHPDAEPDPDRANTAAYARKKLDDLIEIAKANGQNEIEAELERAANGQERDAVAEYDVMKDELRYFIEAFARGLILLNKLDRKAVCFAELDTLEYTVGEAFTKLLEYIHAKPIANMYVDDRMDNLELESIFKYPDRMNVAKESLVDISEEATEPARTWTIYSTMYPDINLLVSSRKGKDSDDFKGSTELIVVTREGVDDLLLPNTESDTSDRT